MKLLLNHLMDPAREVSSVSSKKDIVQFGIGMVMMIIFASVYKYTLESPQTTHVTVLYGLAIMGLIFVIKGIINAARGNRYRNFIKT
jgi:CBS domain containing-hemolysin-like protein